MTHDLVSAEAPSPGLERSTRQRAALLAVFRSADRPLLAAEALELAQQQVPGLGLATVYRNLKALTEEGTLVQVLLPGETPRYEMADRQHHHHFQCVRCQRVFDGVGCPGSLEHLAPAGFVVQGHELTLYGLCRACADGADSAEAAPGSPAA